MQIGTSCVVLTHMLMVDPVHRTNCIRILFNNVMHVQRPIAVTHSVEMLRHNKRIKVTHRYSTNKLYHYIISFYQLYNDVCKLTW